MSTLVISPEPVGERMAGPAIRAYEIARALSRDLDVTLAAPAPSVLAPGDAFELVEAGIADYERVAAEAERHDVVVAQRLPGQLLRRLSRRRGGRLVFDLYNPIVAEVLEASSHQAPAAARRTRRIAALGVLAGLAAADFVVCASERQRDLWLGAMSFAGLLSGAGYRRDPTLRNAIDVVPFGIPAEQVGEPADRPWPGIPPGDRVLLWGGGVWRWLDPITPIRALGRIRERRDDVHLVFLGTGRPVTAEGASTADVVTEESRRLGLLGTAVHVNEGWVPYAQRGPLLAAADIGVSAHRDHLETRFAFRTRLLDYMWAGLPIVTSRGDALGDLVEREGLGAAVAAGDDEAFAAACVRLLDDDGARDRARAAVTRQAQRLRWSETVEPLRRFCADPPPARGRSAIALGSTAGQQAAIAADLLRRRGPAEVGRRLGWATSRSARATLRAIRGLDSARTQSGAERGSRSRDAE